MNLENLVADCKELCYAVAPAELHNSPLWVMLQSNLPPLLGGETVCYGYTSPSLDMHLHHMRPVYKALNCSFPKVRSRWCMAVAPALLQTVEDAVQFWSSQGHSSPTKTVVMRHHLVL